MAEAQPTTGSTAGGRLGAFVRESGYLRKWLILGVAIGVIAGLGAVVFYLALDYTEQFLLGYLGGFVAPDYRFDPSQLIWFLVIGLVSAAVGYLYARIFYGTVALTRRLPGGIVVKPAVGGLLVGLLALLIPQVLSSGYGWVQLATTRESLLTIPLWIVLVLPVAKILATSLSIGTGGSGGIFGPGIVIGAFVGAAIWRLADLAGAPAVPGGPAVFVIAGMMACFGSVAHAPLAVMIMVAEMTGSFSVIPGAMIAVGIAYLIISRTPVSIYRAQRLNRETAAAERVSHPVPEVPEP